MSQTRYNDCIKNGKELSYARKAHYQVGKFLRMSTTSLQYSIERNKETYAAVALPLVTAGIVAAPAVATVTGIGIYAITSIGPVERGLNSTIKFSLRMTGADPVSAESSAQVLTEGFKIYASGVGSSLASKFTAAGIRNTVAAKKDMLFGWFGKIRSPAGMTKQSNISLGYTRSEINQYLENINNISREQLIVDLKSLGMSYVGGNPQRGFHTFKHEVRGFTIRIDGPHSAGPNSANFPHIHIVDKFGRTLNAKLRVVDSNSPDAHIQIADIAKILLENKL